MNISIAEFRNLLDIMEKENLSIPDIIARVSTKVTETSDAVSASPFNPEKFSLTVDYTNNLLEMIGAGKYDWYNDDISEKHFPSPAELIGKSIEVECEIFHFNCEISSENAIAEMDKVAYRPATLAELPSLGVDQPELQRQFPIIALGSVWQRSDDDRYVPYLGVVGHKRELSLFWLVDGWHAHCWFLAVRK